MAYLNENLTDEQLKQQQNQLSTGSTGAGALIGSGGVGSNGIATQKPSASGSFTNLNKYLSLNAPQTEQLANQVAGQITTQGEAAKNAISPLKTSYESTLKSSGYDPQMLQSAVNDPVSFANDPNNVSAFSNLRQGLFTPAPLFSSLPGYGEAATKATSASNLSNLAANEGGQKTLLNQINPSMNQGNVDLNTSLLQGNKSAREKLIQSAQPYSGLADYFKNLESTNNATQQQQIANNQNLATQTQEQFVKPRTQELKGLESDINQRLTNAYPKQLQTFNANRALSVPYAIPNLSSLEGLQTNEIPTLSNISTPDEYAKILALQQLLGQDEFLSPSNKNLAGTYTPIEPSKAGQQKPTINKLNSGTQFHKDWGEPLPQLNNYVTPTNPQDSSYEQFLKQSALAGLTGMGLNNLNRIF